MKIEDILSLSNAGFTPEQITGLIQLMRPGSEQSNAVPEHYTTPNVDPEHYTTPNAAHNQHDNVRPSGESNADLVSQMAALSTHIATLTNALQAMAILKSEQPEEPNVNDILASIINPTGKEN